MSFLKNSVYMAVANFFQLISAYVLSVWVGRFLGPADFGKYITIISIFGIMNVFITNGTSQAIAKVIAEDKRLASGITGQLIRWGIPLMIVVSAVFYFLVAPLISLMLKDSSLLFHIQLLTPIIPLYSLGAIYAGYFIGREQFGLQTIKSILISIGKILLTVLLTIPFMVTGAIGGLSLVGLIGICFSLFFIRANPFKKMTDELKIPLIKIIRLLFPMTAYMFLITLFQQLGVFISKIWLSSDALTGYFGAAKSVLQIPTSLFSAISIVMLTTVSSSFASYDPHRTRHQLMEIFKYTLMLLVPGMLFMAAGPAEIVKLVYGSSYIQGSGAFFILSIGGLFFIFCGFLAMILSGIGKVTFTAVVAAIMTGVHFGVGFLLVHTFGIEGVAFSFAAASVVGFIISMWYSYTQFGSFIDLKSLAKIMLISLVLFFALRFFSGHGIIKMIIAWIAAGLVYLAFLFVSKEITRREINYVIGMIRKQPAPAEGMVEKQNL
jgi:O-antigen/teichoic acid export membrane protein